MFVETPLVVLKRLKRCSLYAMKTIVTANQLYFRFDPQYNPYMNIRRIHNQLAYLKNK